MTIVLMPSATTEQLAGTHVERYPVVSCAAAETVETAAVARSEASMAAVTAVLTAFFHLVK
jgi:hypothetical protein